MYGRPLIPDYHRGYAFHNLDDKCCWCKRRNEPLESYEYHYLEPHLGTVRLARTLPVTGGHSPLDAANLMGLDYYEGAVGGDRSRGTQSKPEDTPT